MFTALYSFASNHLAFWYTAIYDIEVNEIATKLKALTRLATCVEVWFNFVFVFVFCTPTTCFSSNLAFYGKCGQTSANFDFFYSLNANAQTKSSRKGLVRN